MRLKQITVLISAVATAGSAAVILSPPASADPAIAGTYNLLPVQRIVDTRHGVGAPTRPIGAGQTLAVKATAGITGSVGVVNLTITAASPTRNGFLTAYAGSTRPGVATLNFTAGESVPNSAPIAVGSDGVVSIYNGSPGTVDVTVDRAGYWTGSEATVGGAFVPATPTRIADSRQTPGTPIPARASRSVAVTGAAGVPSGADSVVVNLGAALPASSGYLTATGSVTDETDDSRTSTVSFSAGRSRSNLVYVPVDSDGTISLYNGSSAPLDYVVDIVGYIIDGAATDGGSAVIASPTRIADSRIEGGPIAARGTRVVQIIPTDAPQGIFSAVIVHVTATRTTSSGFLTAWQGGRRPPTSVTNFTPGVARTGTAIVPVSSTGSISLYNGSTAPVSYVIDLQGLVASEQTGAMQQATAQRRIASVETKIRAAARKQNR